MSNDWERVSWLFENSLRSAYQQNDPDIRIIAVCHEIPRLQSSFDERVELISVDFPPPPTPTTRTMQDKWRKIAIGLIRAGTLKPNFVMIMDADDLVSRRLSSYTRRHPAANGWIFSKGYRYQYGSPWIYLDDRFNCGTNAIVNSRLIRFPTCLEESEINQCVLLKHGHTTIAHTLAEAGTPLSPLPFPGAIYVHNHGDNDSMMIHRPPRQSFSLRHFLGTMRHTRPLIPQIKTEFSITETCG